MNKIIKEVQPGLVNTCHPVAVQTQTELMQRAVKQAATIHLVALLRVPTATTTTLTKVNTKITIIILTLVGEIVDNKNIRKDIRLVINRTET